MEVVELKVRLHCKACEKAVRKTLCNIKGVKCVEIDMVSSKITVLGYVNRKVIVKAIWKTGRKVESWHKEEDCLFSPRLPTSFKCIFSKLKRSFAMRRLSSPKDQMNLNKLVYMRDKSSYCVRLRPP